ncbi:hypothetical protein CR513_58617, partial [Mucuna pruriens]
MKEMRVLYNNYYRWLAIFRRRVRSKPASRQRQSGDMKRQNGRTFTPQFKELVVDPFDSFQDPKVHFQAFQTQLQVVLGHAERTSDEVILEASTLVHRLF